MFRFAQHKPEALVHVLQEEDGFHREAVEVAVVSETIGNAAGTGIRQMSSPFEILRVADLIELAADTAKACSEMQESPETARITELSLRIKAAAEELQQVGREKERNAAQGRKDH